MSNIVIHSEEISKRYLIGEKEEIYRTIRSTLSKAVVAPIAAFRSKLHSSGNGHSKKRNWIWALKDISFDIKQGDVVGVVGQNGAGKSTLLKILSRITEPTEGSAVLYGRVGSLLEVGTGFHPELTGRENIYLNGAIIGMKKFEISRKFDEIVDFSEIEKFIDTPVKHYSSGMFLRLAFSVAAHLEPEILLVDEVLAVGDMAFQRKCLGKMEETAAKGRTVLFVSHNLAAVKELCNTGIVLRKGRVDYHGPIVEALAHYGRTMAQFRDADTEAGRNGWRQIFVNGRSDGGAFQISAREYLAAEALLSLTEDFSAGPVFCIINNSIGEVVVHQRVELKELADNILQPGLYRFSVELPPLWLASGVYSLYFKFLGRRLSGREQRHISERVLLDVEGGSIGTGRALLAPSAKWSVTPEDSL